MGGPRVSHMWLCIYTAAFNLFAVPPICLRVSIPSRIGRRIVVLGNRQDFGCLLLRAGWGVGVGVGGMDGIRGVEEINGGGLFEFQTQIKDPFPPPPCLFSISPA